MIDVRIPEIKSLVSKSVSCKITDIIVLESRYGKVTFDLSGFEFKELTINLKRISGNGKILINDNPVCVTSKSAFVKTISQVSSITIARPKEGIGEVAVVGIVLHMDEFEGENLSAKWKDALSRTEHKCLRVSSGKLLASQGAYISNESAVKVLETTPPNAFTRTDGRIKFQIPCEIVSLEIDTSLPVMHKSHDLFVPREAPAPIITPQETPRPTSGERPLPPNRHKLRTEYMSSLILYDSTVSREFSASKFSPQNKTVKSIRSNNIDYLVLKKGGTFSIVASIFRPNVEYVAVVTAKKLNGNGRLQLEIPNGPPSNIIIDSDMLEYYVSVKSTNTMAGNKLTLSMPDNGVGELLISRVQIIEGIQLYSFRNMQRGDDTKVNQQSYEVAKTLSSLNVQYGTTIDEATLDEIARTTKKYARQRICFGVESTNLSVNGTVMSSTFSGISWLNKVGPMFPTVHIHRSKSPGDLSAYIGDKTNLQPASKIWLEPFDTLTSNQLDILRQSKMVISPSAPNVSYLDSQLGSVIVVQATKPIPFVAPEEVGYFKNLDYVLAFNRNAQTTKRILDSWEEGMPKIVLIGARGKYPDFVVPVNEYVDYHKLLYIILKARCVIDLPRHIDYNSAMLHFITKAGIPVVTSNWFGMNKANCDFILTNEKVDDIKIPSIDNLRYSVKDAFERSRQDSDLENYNENLNAFMSLLMGT